MHLLDNKAFDSLATQNFFGVVKNWLTMRDRFIDSEVNSRAQPRVRKDSSVGVATRYMLDSPAIESRWGTGLNFPRPSTLAQGSTQPTVQ